MTRTVLLPLEGSEPGDSNGSAVERALELGERHDAVVHALFVVDTGRYGEPALSSAEIVVDNREDEGHALLRAVADRGRDRGVEVETRCCHGRPNEELVGYAEEVDADVVVLGGRRRPRKTVEALDRVADSIETPASTVAG